ncbi:MAG: serine hydrolase [Gemmatimonadetes bacterium]|nr:serine hydrolase [Gemmatimonadota bacterium]MDA1103413.1 serine hydrolase [Gemmatimonadota bacterium]
MNSHLRATLGALAAITLVGCTTDDSRVIPTSDGSDEQLIARALALELDTEYTPPPGLALHHYTSGFAKILCSAVFITGLDAADAAANVGGFTSPFDQRGHVVDTVVDYARQMVSLTLPDGVTRTAKRYKNQGCVAHPIGVDSIYYTPTEVARNLPPAATTPWPMGDVRSTAPWPAEVNRELVEQALDVGFGPAEAMTLGLVVTYKGRILGERYGEGIGIHTPLESWSMGKSLTGTLVGVLIHQGAYELWQPAPFPQWQSEGDPRQAIRIGDIMRMSSGLRINAPGDPDYDESTYADHLYYYTGTANSFEWAATRPQQWPPNTVGRYRNTDPVLANYLVRLAVEGRGEEYHSFPQRALFDKIGIRDAIIETDPYGNFLGQGYEFLPARDWARLGNLYLQDGVWNGERLLPEGYVEYASTLAPAWVADGRLQYGGAFFWVNGEEGQNLPASAYSMRGAGGQSATIIPTHDLVVVRLGKYSAARQGGQALNEAFRLLMEAVPPVAR